MRWEGDSSFRFFFLLLLWSWIKSVTATVPTMLECKSCDAPMSNEIPFCTEFVKYTACRTRSSWAEMDSAAEIAYNRVTNTTAATTVPTECLSAIKKAECSKEFNVCELGSSQSFCLASCVSVIAANCSTSLSTAKLNATQDALCGNSTVPIAGVSDSDKCFDANYVGPQHTAWLIGFIIAVVFSFLASVGINLQKKALKQNELNAHEHNVEPKPAYRLPLWCLGFVLIVAGSILDFVAFGLAPQSLLAPLAALTLVWNMMLAPCFNKEKLSRKDIAATLVIFAGATIAVVFATHTSPSYNLDMLVELYKDPLTCVYFTIVVLCVGVHFLLIHIVEKLSLVSRRHRIIQAGQPAVWSRVRLVAYSGLSGTMGGQSVLFAKSSAELLKAQINGDDCLAHIQTYLIVFGLIACLLCQIHYLNRGLVHFDALSVVPIYQAYWIISGVLGGVIYFQEIRTFSVEQACMFVLGIMTTIFGVVLLSQRKVAPPLSHSKKKFERGYSFSSATHSKLDSIKPTGMLPTVAEMPTAVETSGVSPPQDTEAMATIGENEHEMSTTEESEDDEVDDTGGGDALDQVNRQAIDNYLDMSATVLMSELLGELGFQSAQQQRGLFSRRQSSRIAGNTVGSHRRNRRSVDDIEVGMPQATREANPRERVAKRRSITFTTFLNSKKDPPLE